MPYHLIKILDLNPLKIDSLLKDFYFSANKSASEWVSPMHPLHIKNWKFICQNHCDLSFLSN